MRKVRGEGETWDRPAGAGAGCRVVGHSWKCTAGRLCSLHGGKALEGPGRCGGSEAEEGCCAAGSLFTHSAPPLGAGMGGIENRCRFLESDAFGAERTGETWLQAPAGPAILSGSVCHSLRLPNTLASLSQGPSGGRGHGQSARAHMEQKHL